MPGVDLESGELCRVTTVFSTKGGAGKSVIAANLLWRSPAAATVRWCSSTPTSSSATSQ